MQSQQKKVKWSRGETADALEERTDTGITQVSVSKLENIITDIYGNISRRPALKLMPFGSPLATTNLDQTTGGHLFPAVSAQFIPFFITEDDFFVLAVPTTAGDYAATGIVGYRITNNKLVDTLIVKDEFGNTWTAGAFTGEKDLSYAQQNNYLLIANRYWIYKLTLTYTNGQHEIIATPFKYDGAWYAPDGTKSYTVTKADITGLTWSANYINFVWQNDAAGTNTSLSATSTGVSSQYAGAIPGKIPTGSIVKTPNAGSYFRVDQYAGYDQVNHYWYQVIFPNIFFDELYGPNDTVTNTGTCLKVESVTTTATETTFYVAIYKDTTVVQTARFTNFNYFNSLYHITAFGNHAGVQMCYFTTTQNYWTALSPSNVKVYAIGSLLTPVADNSATDSILDVESGYIETNPDYNVTYAMYPHFSLMQFKDQRLWTSGYYHLAAHGADTMSGLVIGSQIAKYTDFKNDYNLANEPIVVDILTKHREEVIHLADYNGLKIFTDNAEYNYDPSSGVVKQSENGALRNCRPLVFSSILLYADHNGKAIKAMQYELQSDVFGSNIINQMSQNDLVNFPITFAAYEDKEHHTGKFLYILNTEAGTSPTLAVCNLVPGNQAMIWARWTMPSLWGYFGAKHPAITDITTTKTPIFWVTARKVLGGSGNDVLLPAILDYENTLDFEADITPGTNIYKIIEYGTTGAIYTSQAYITLPGGNNVAQKNNIVSAFDGNEYKFDSTIDTTGTFSDIGELTTSVADFTAPKIGLMINATLESHPIDVGGRTYTDHKRIGKAVAVIRDTEPNAFTVCDKTGYTSNDKKKVNFYGCTGMKDQIRYTIKNIQGAKFTIESLTMIIEYATLDS